MIRKSLIQQLTHSREKLLASLVGIDPQFELNPGLTIKDMLAHISAWDEVSVNSLHLLLDGDEPTVTVTQGIDAFNDAATTAYREFGYEEALQKLETNRRDFIDVIDKMPEKMLTMEFTLPWGMLGTVQGIVKIMAEHEEEHVEEIEAL